MNRELGNGLVAVLQKRDLSISQTQIGYVLVAQGDGAGALAAFRRGLAIAEALTARDPANTEWQRDAIVSLVNVGEATGDKTFGREGVGCCA